MKKIFERLRNKLVRSAMVPNVTSFDQARIYCENKNSSSYQSELLCKYRFEKLNEYIKNNKLFFNHSSNNMLLLSICYFFNYYGGRIPKILDFGGACGENILFLQSIFGNNIYRSSWVIETEAHVKESKNWKFAKNIQFSSDIKNILDNQNIDIFYSSCAINYLESPYELLSLVEKNKVPFICLTRNNFSLNPKPFIQVSNLSDNGNGEHLECYGNQKIWYPSQSINEEKIKNIFLNGNYDLLVDECLNKTGLINKKKNYAKDLIFKLI